MRGVSRILAIVDTRKENHLALDRATQLAKASGAHLHILAPNPKPDDASIQYLEAVADKIDSQGVETTIHEVWKEDLTETIIHVRQVERCHLVVKDYKPEGGILSTFSTPNDWNLLRRCRVPVLLVRHNRPWNGANMLAAINADPEDANHQLLNQAILENASQTARLFDAPLKIASAHPTTMLALQDKGNGITSVDSYIQVCRHLASEFDLPEEAIKVRPGPADTMIPDLCREISVELLIMGTQARTGIPAIALGNTAEQIISDIDTDLLVVQPKHHMIPLERELEQ
ncbi:MAG: universal stress protein [Endozoicomonas sp.]